jgi:hypothetical protein
MKGKMIDIILIFIRLLNWVFAYDVCLQQQEGEWLSKRVGA